MSRKLIICLLASMVIRRPLLLKMRGVSDGKSVVSVKSYVCIKVLELGEQKASHEFTCFCAVVYIYIYIYILFIVLSVIG